MKYLARFTILISILITGYSCLKKGSADYKNSITIENTEFSLIISNKGEALSLKHKATTQECLQEGVRTPMFAVTQYRPYRSEHFLTLPNKHTNFYGDSLHREGNNLIVYFTDIGYKATIGLNITDHYIGFKLKGIEQMEIETFKKRPVMLDEFTLMQLPVKDREYFGDWLNVSWDNEVAVTLLGTDPYCRIDANAGGDFHVMKADMKKDVRLYNVGAALIVSGKDGLLNCIDQLEKDYKLPRGVKSRRNKASRYSYFWARDVRPENIDEYLSYALKGGFKAFMISTNSFSTSGGHFPWKPEYPNGIEDLKAMVKKIEDAGMVAGIHFYFNKAMKRDKYVSPVPDPRLNLRKIFTLAESLDDNSNTVSVEENPEGCILSDGQRILKIGEELIEYTSYTTSPPYQFRGCSRGILNTRISNHPEGLKMGVLDVDDWNIWVRFDQRTSIQKEIAQRIAGIYNKAGFKFAYFDGAEDVHPPYWFNISNAQWEVYKLLDPEPLFVQAAAKSHFGWHMISVANAYDIFPPEVIKRRTKRWKVRDAKFYIPDFTKNNFGWNGYFAPNGESDGTQPDMYEYVACQAAAWGCPVSLCPSLGQLNAHPRTPDNLEVMRRWEEAQLAGFLSDKQKTVIKNNPDQEFILLIDESGSYELQPYEQVREVAQGNTHIRAYTFKRGEKSYAVYWHTSGNGKIFLKLSAEKVRLYEQLGKKLQVTATDNGVIVPVDGRLYLETDLSTEELTTAFKYAEIL